MVVNETTRNGIHNNIKNYLRFSASALQHLILRSIVSYHPFFQSENEEIETMYRKNVQNS